MLAAIGTLSLGIFLGYMTWYFATRVTDKVIDSFVAIVGVLFGGVVLAFIGGAAQDSRWFYPIGLVIGWIIYFFLRWFMGKGIPTLVEGPDAVGNAPIRSARDRIGSTRRAAQQQAQAQQREIQVRERRNRETADVDDESRPGLQ